MTSKERYARLTSSIQVPVFLQPLWLDIVCEHWDVVLYEEAGKILGGMPYAYRMEKGNMHIVQPPLTQFVGPILNFSYDKKEKQYGKENQVLTALLEQLPAFRQFNQNWYHGVDNWLPFFWNGFQQSCRYTYVIDGSAAEKDVWDSLKNTIRNDIRAADQATYIEESTDSLSLYKLVEQNFEYKQQAVPYTYEMYKKMAETLLAAGWCKIYLVRSQEDKQLVAGGLFIMDEKTTYYLIGAINRSFKIRGALEKMLWHVIKDTLAAKRDFDFEGSMLKNVEPLFRSFGGERKMYFSISKSYRTKKDLLMEIMRNGKKIFMGNSQ